MDSVTRPLSLPSACPSAIAFEIDARLLRRHAKRPRHIAQRFHDGKEGGCDDLEAALNLASRNRQRLLDERTAKLATHHGHVRTIQRGVARSRQFQRRSTLLAIENTLKSAHLNRLANLELRRSQSARAVAKAKQVAKSTHLLLERRALDAQKSLKRKLRASQWRRNQILKLSRSSLNNPDALEHCIRERAVLEIQAWWRMSTVGPSMSRFMEFFNGPSNIKSLARIPESLRGALDVDHLKAIPFPSAAKVLQMPNVIRSAARFLKAIKKCAHDPPKLGKTPTRVFLTVFMLSSHREAIMDDPEGVLEMELLGTASTLMAAIRSFNSILPLSFKSAEAFHLVISDFLRAWFAYHTTFEAFKRKDTKSVVDNMIAHALELARIYANVTSNRSDVTEAEWKPSIVKQLKLIRQRLIRVGGSNSLVELSSALEQESLAYVLDQLNLNQRPSSPSPSADENTDSVLVPSPMKRRLRETSSTSGSTSQSHDTVNDSVSSRLILTNHNEELEGIMSNHALAHELVMDPEFTIKSPVATGVAASVKQVAERAFADQLNEMVQRNEYSFITGLLEEIRDDLKYIARQASSGGEGRASQIHELLDPQTALLQIQNMAVVDLSQLLQSILETVQSLAAPSRDIEISELLDNAVSLKFGDVVLQIQKLINNVRLDVVNFHLGQLRPMLKVRAVEYEAKKFNERVAATGYEKSLSCTRTWLSQVAKTMLGTYQQRNPEGVPLTEATRPKFEDVYHEAILSLVFPNNNVAVSPGIVPETLSMDVGRLYTMQNTGQAIAITGALVMVVRNAFPWMRTATINVEEMAKPALRGGRPGPTCKQAVLAAQLLANQLMEQLSSETTPSSDHIASLILSWITEGWSAHTSSHPASTHLTQSQKEMVPALVLKTLSAQDPVLAIVSRRVHTSVRNYLSLSSAAQTVDPATRPPVRIRRDSLTANGLDVVEQPINTLGAAVAALARHNKAVYAPWYDEILAAALSVPTHP